LFSHYFDNAVLLLSSLDYICYKGRIDSPWCPKISMTFAPPNRTRAGVSLSAAALSASVARARPGERLVYHRGLLPIDRIKGTSALNEAARRKLNAVADHTLALSNEGRLYLLQERHGEGDYSYWAVARSPARFVSHFSIDQRSRGPRL
jgi:hypothetical protein